MASRASFSDDLRMIKKPLPKSLLLRDYLLDDMSSCSSNGFRSYPRRQCCATVRFSLETDRNKNRKLPSTHHRRSVAESRMINWKLNFKSKQSSVLQKASAMMISALKHLPFAGTGVSRKANLPRSLSWKLFKHDFWKKSDNHDSEIKMLKSFGDLLKEQDMNQLPSPSPCSTVVTTTATAELTSSTSYRNSSSGSDFTATTESSTTTTTGYYTEVNLAHNDVADKLPENKKTTNGTRVGATTATASNYSDTTENAKKGQDKHEEQFSPVSVMDFPSDDDNDTSDEDRVSSMSRHKYLNNKGTHRSTYTTQRFDCFPRLEPIKLEDRIAQSVSESLTLTHNVQEGNQIESKALMLLELMKSAISSHHLSKYEAVESFLLGFFKEKMIEENSWDYEMLQTAKDWMDGKQKMFIDWEYEKNWQTYLSDMEKGVNWSNYDHEIEKVNIGLEVECEIFNSLVNDVLIGFIVQEFDLEVRGL